MVYVTYSIPDAGLLALFPVRRCSLAPDEMTFLPPTDETLFFFPFPRQLHCLFQSFASYLYF